jgi:hypothetical protein
MSSSYNYEKALSLEWNGQVYVLTVRNETPLGGANYLYSSDGKSWYSSSDLSGSKLLTQANPYNVKWTGTNYAMIGDVANTDGNTILRGGPAATKFSALSLASQGTNVPLYDLEANLEFPHTITFPRNTTLALGGAAADTTKIAFSLDGGITWTASYNSSAVFSVTANNAVWNGKLWVAVGQGGNTIATSTDGNVWVGRGSYIFSVAGQGIAWSPQLALWVAAGQGTNSLAYSSDGVYWIGLGTSMLGSGVDVQWNDTVWVAIGNPSVSNKSIAYSYDGKKWNNPPQTNLFDLSGTKAAWNGYFWTAVGTSSPANNLYNMGTSIDGIYWYMQKNTNFSVNITNVYTNPTVTNEIMFTTYGSQPAGVTNLAATASTSSSISFTFTAPTFFSITSVPNCQLWLDAATSSTIITSGSNVTQWNDRSGLGRHATLYNTTYSTYNATGLNNLPTVNFSATSCGMSCPMPSGTFTPTTGISVFAIFNTSATLGSGSVFGRTYNNLPDPIDLYNSSRLSGPSGSIQSSTSTLNLTSLTNPTLFNIVVGVSSWNEWTNGTLAWSSTFNSNFNESSNATKFFIGTRWDKGTNFVGNISEILVYSAMLTTTQRQNIEGYLAWKWGIQASLPAGHPYVSAAPSTGVPPTSYTVGAAPATGSNIVQTVAYGATSGTVTGLTSATSYNLTMVSNNSSGSSAPTNTVTYQTQLAPPTNLTFVSNTTTSITFSFTPPVLGQGVVITSYTATAVPASGSTVTLTGISPSATSATITSLVASTQYTITMVAINSYGTSATSAALIYQTGLTTPNVIVFSSATTTSVTFTFTPITLGTSVTVTYTATLVPTSGLTVTQTGITSSPVTVNGLVNGMNYTVTLVVTNSYSTSASSTGVVVQPLLQAPTNLTKISVTTTSINFSFTPPPAGTITSYTATATPTAPAVSPVVTLTGISSSATSANITGLVASTQYSVTLVAISAYGTSAASSALILETVLGPPTELLGTISDLSSITFSYVAPILGTGVAVNTYTATVVSASGSTTTIPNITSSPVTVSGLTYPVTYTISMIAINGNSTSASSTAITYATSAYAQLTSFKPSPDISGTSVYNSTNYSVYVFRTTGTTYDISYTCASPAQMYVLAVGGGGGGGASGGGGGGAGGVVMTPVSIPGSASNQRITISVGTGGAGVANGNNGGNGVATSVTFPTGSVPSSIVASGGGGGGCNGVVGYTGGSGGGSGHQYTSLQTNSYSNNYNFGNAGGYSTSSNNGAGGGGGGAGIAGNNSYATAGYGSAGGNGIQCFLPGIATFSPSGTAYSTYYWGGGGGGSANCGASPSLNGGGLGGGGGGSNNGAGTAGVGGGSALNSGANGAVSNGTAGAAGANTGGGGGGAYTGNSGAGGSGIVIIALPNSAIISSYQAVLSPAQVSNSGFFDTLSMRGLTTAAYNSILMGFSGRLLNYNYFGPTMTLRYSTDVSGIYTQNFYADSYGNLWTQYGNTGTPLLQWLYTKGGSQTYAYVTKWYDQGMDASFNCATQYVTTTQPIYDVSYQIINFGYTGSGGGVLAPQTGCSLNLPSLVGLTAGDVSVSNTFKVFNATPGGTSGVFQLGPVSVSGQEILAFLGTTNWQYAWYGTNYGNTAYSQNNVVSMTYASGQGSSGGMNVYVNGVNSGPFSPGALNYSIASNKNVLGYYVLSGTTNQYFNAQMYFFYFFKSTLSTVDRPILEATNTSILPQIPITMTGYSSTTLAGNFPVVTNASTYVFYVNGVAVTPATNTVSSNIVYVTFTGLSNTNYTTTVLTVYAYTSLGALIASGTNPQMTAPTAITALNYSSVYPTSFVITWSGGVGYATTISYTLGGVPTTPSSSGVGTATFTGSFTYPLVVSVTATNFLSSATSSTSVTTAAFSSVSITNIMGNDNNTTYTTNSSTYYISTLTRTDASYVVSYTTASSTLMYVLAVGGGAGGGSYDSGGGGAGGVVITPVLIPSGSGTITVSIGAGGAGAPSGGTASNGGTTFISFSAASGSNITAFGGQGVPIYYNGGNAGNLSTGTNNAYLNFAYIGGAFWGPRGGVAAGGGGGGAGTTAFSNVTIDTGAGNASTTFYSAGGNGIQCLLAPIANYTPTSKSIISSYYWGGGGGGGTNYGTVSFINVNGGLGGAGGGTGSFAGTAGANGYNAGTNGVLGGGTNGGAAGANTGSGGGGSLTGLGGNGGSGFVALAFPQFSQSYLVTNYNFTSPAVSGSNTVTLNPTTVTGWTLTGTGSGSSNLVNNTTGVTGTYGNYMIGTGSNGYTYASPYVTCFLVQFYNQSSNSFSITSTPFFMAARTYSVSFITATRSIFDASNIMTVSLAGGSVSTSTTFTTSNILNPWKPLAFTCTPATAGNYSLTVTWSTTNVNDTTMAISQILVV